MRFRPGAGFSLALLLGALGALVVAADKTPAPRASGKRALAHVRALVGFGERPPGSPGHRQAQNYILGQLHQLGVEVEEVDFVAQTPRGPVRMKNIIGKIPGKAGDLIVLAGHYDTLHKKGFVGANDGGSSTALLLELARVLRKTAPNPVTVWVVFFDGEEALVQWNAADGLYGSRYQAEAWERAGVLARLRALLVVDMIGDKHLTVRRDLNSTPELTELIWQVARDRRYHSYFLDDSLAIEDDHVPFVQAGVPAVNLIDYDYGPGNRYWHTPADTLDKLSPHSFAVVGEVVLETLKRLTPPSAPPQSR